MAGDDRMYCLRRASEERLRAAKAACSVARKAHDDLAAAYEARLYSGITFPTQADAR